MNRRLVLYVDTDFLMAAVKPFGTLIPVTVKDEMRVPLFFFVDTASNRIFHGARYQPDFEDDAPNTFGNFLHSITDERLSYQVFQYTVPVVELLKTVMDDLRRQYLSILGELTSSIDPAARIPVSMVFSDTVSEDSKKAFSTYLQRIGYETDATAFVAAEMLALSLFESGKLAHPQHKKIVVAEALNENLNYSLVQCYNASAVERIAQHTYPLMGVDSRVNVVATYTVNYINNQRRLLQDKAEIDREYKRHFRFAKDWVRQLDTETRPFLDVKTGFAIEKSTDNKVVLKKEEMEQLVAYHIRNLGQTFELFLSNNNHRAEDIDRIVLVGESLANSRELTAEFARFGAGKVLVCDANDDKGLLNGVFLRQQYQEKPETAPQNPMPTTETAKVPDQFEQVIVTSQLDIGQQLELGWNDRLVRVMHVGGSRFLVTKHYNSLIVTGDQFTIDTLLLGKQPVFKNVIHGGKPVNDYNPSGTLNVLKKV